MNRTLTRILKTSKKIKKMEMNNALQEVIVAPSLSKATQSTIAEDLIAQVMTGMVDPMQAFIQIKAIAEVCEMFLKDAGIVEKTMDTVASYDGNLPALNGAKVTLTSTTRYDYASSRDPEYLELARQKEDVANKMKAREMFLKTLESEIDVLNRETGELATIFPPVKNQSKSLRVTFAKQ